MSHVEMIAFAFIFIFIGGFSSLMTFVSLTLLRGELRARGAFLDIKEW